MEESEPCDQDDEGSVDKGEITSPKPSTQSAVDCDPPADSWESALLNVQPDDALHQPIYDTSWPTARTTTTSSTLESYDWYNDIPSDTYLSEPPVEPPPPPNRSIYPLQTLLGYRVQVKPYDPTWHQQFEAIKTHLHNVFTTSTLPAPYTTIEHIGSTSIPDLAAKPNIDILVTLPNHTALTHAIDALEWEIPRTAPYIRYTRVPNGGGVQGRESFKLYLPEWSAYYLDTPERSVYLIDESEGNRAGRVQIRCYRAVRDTLREPVNEDLRDEYGSIKIELAERTYEDSITYSRLKDDVVRKILRRAGWTEEDIDEKERLSERVWVGEELPY